MFSDAAMPSPSLSHPAKQSRRRVPKTCGECRRLKLRCDRVFPCQSCVKRGCEGICPEGSLVSGRGSRYILANTEQLHVKIDRMAERIRELEEALKAISEEHARCLNSGFPSSGPSHPLLREDLLLIKNQLELYGPDRSQLASRSDVSYTSDGSDGEHARLGNEQELLATSYEALIFGPEDRLLGSQVAQYTGNSSFNTVAQTTTNAPLSDNQWASNRQGTILHSTEFHTPNSNGTPFVPSLSTSDALSALDYQLDTLYGPGSAIALRNYADTSTTHRSDGTGYLSLDVVAQDGSGSVNQACSIWELERCIF